MNWSQKVIPFQLHPLGFIDAFSRFGAEYSRLLEASRLDKELVELPESKISYLDFFRLIRQGIRLCNKPGLGLLAGQYFKWYYHGLMGVAVMSSSSFRQATRILQRYVCIAQPYYLSFQSKPFYFVDNQQRLIVPIENLLSSGIEDEEVRCFEIEYRLSLLLRILKHFCATFSGKLPGVVAELSIPKPFYWNLYKELPCSNFQFDCPESRIIFPLQLAWSELDLLRNGVCQHILQYCHTEMQKIEQDVPYSEKVRQLLVQSIPGHLNQKQVADAMGMTTRTLARKLRLENATFTDLLNDVRSEIAIYFLKSTQLSIADVGECLGFTDTSNFRQAFKRWTGRSACDFIVG